MLANIFIQHMLADWTYLSVLSPNHPKPRSVCDLNSPAIPLRKVIFILFQRRDEAIPRTVHFLFLVRNFAYEDVYGSTL